MATDKPRLRVVSDEIEPFVFPDPYRAARLATQTSVRGRLILRLIAYPVSLMAYGIGWLKRVVVVAYYAGSLSVDE